MVMHARKPQRIGDGYHFEKHQAHPYQSESLHQPTKSSGENRDLKGEDPKTFHSLCWKQNVGIFAIQDAVFSNSKYSSSKSSYERERMRERDSPNGNSYRSESPECDSPRDRDRLYHNKTSSYVSKSRDRDYKSNRDKYSDCVRSPKDKRSRIDSDHRTNHDRNSSEKMLLNPVKSSQNSSRETSQRKVSSSCQDKRDDRDRVTRVGDWSEHVSSSGKKYYYNCKTEVSQWEKPREWVERSHRHTSSSSSSSTYLHHSSSSHPNSRTGGSNVVDKHSNSRGGVVSSNVGSSKPVQQQQVVSQSQPQPVMPPQSVQSVCQLPPQAPPQGMVPPPQGVLPPPQGVLPPPQGVLPPPQGILPSQQGVHTPQGVPMPQVSQACAVGVRGSVQPVPPPTAVPPPAYWNTSHIMETQSADPRKQQDSQPINSGGAMVDGVATDMDICSGDSTPTSETNYSMVGSGTAVVPSSAGQSIGAAAEGGSANAPGPPLQPLLVRLSPNADSTHRSDQHSPPTPVHENQDCKVGGSLLAGSSLAALRPQGPNLTPSLANHYRDDLVNHVRGWPADMIEKQAQKLSEEAYQLGTMCARVSAELKCPRSIVRQTEIQATRQEQRVLFLRQQIKTLEELKSQNSFMADET